MRKLLGWIKKAQRRVLRRWPIISLAMTLSSAYGLVGNLDKAQEFFVSHWAQIEHGLLWLATDTGRLVVFGTTFVCGMVGLVRAVAAPIAHGGEANSLPAAVAEDNGGNAPIPKGAPGRIGELQAPRWAFSGWPEKKTAIDKPHRNATPEERAGFFASVAWVNDDGSYGGHWVPDRPDSVGLGFDTIGTYALMTSPDGTKQVKVYPLDSTLRESFAKLPTRKR